MENKRFDFGDLELDIWRFGIRYLVIWRIGIRDLVIWRFGEDFMKYEVVGSNLELEMMENCTKSCKHSSAVQVFSLKKEIALISYCLARPRCNRKKL